MNAYDGIKENDIFDLLSIFFDIEKDGFLNNYENIFRFLTDNNNYIFYLDGEKYVSKLKHDISKKYFCFEYEFGEITFTLSDLFRCSIEYLKLNINYLGKYQHCFLNLPPNLKKDLLFEVSKENQLGSFCKNNPLIFELYIELFLKDNNFKSYYDELINCSDNETEFLKELEVLYKQKDLREEIPQTLKEKKTII